MYDFQRCPKIVAIKAYKALRTFRRETYGETAVSKTRRVLEPAVIGSIGEAAVRLGLSDVSTTTAMREIEREILVKIPRLYVRDYLRQIAVESLSGVKLIRGKLAQEYGDIAIIGKGTGRNPDLCGTVQPDYIALPANSKEPVIVERKNSSRQNPEDMFQAKVL